MGMVAILFNGPSQYQISIPLWQKAPHESLKKTGSGVSEELFKGGRTTDREWSQ